MVRLPRGLEVAKRDEKVALSMAAVVVVGGLVWSMGGPSTGTGSTLVRDAASAQVVERETTDMIARGGQGGDPRVSGMSEVPPPMKMTGEEGGIRAQSTRQPILLDRSAIAPNQGSFTGGRQDDDSQDKAADPHHSAAVSSRIEAQLRRLDEHLGLDDEQLAALREALADRAAIPAELRRRFQEQERLDRPRYLALRELGLQLEQAVEDKIRRALTSAQYRLYLEDPQFLDRATSDG